MKNMLNRNKKILIFSILLVISFIGYINNFSTDTLKNYTRLISADTKFAGNGCTPSSGPVYKIVTAYIGLNVRTGPGTSYNTYGNPLSYGSTVRVYCTTNGWSRISASKNLYVSSTYLRNGGNANWAQPSKNYNVSVVNTYTNYKSYDKFYDNKNEGIKYRVKIYDMYLSETGDFKFTITGPDGSKIGDQNGSSSNLWDVSNSTEKFQDGSTFIYVTINTKSTARVKAGTYSVRFSAGNSSDTRNFTVVGDYYKLGNPTTTLVGKEKDNKVNKQVKWNTTFGIADEIDFNKNNFRIEKIEYKNNGNYNDATNYFSNYFSIDSTSGNNKSLTILYKPGWLWNDRALSGNYRLTIKYTDPDANGLPPEKVTIEFDLGKKTITWLDLDGNKFKYTDEDSESHIDSNYNNGNIVKNEIHKLIKSSYNIYFVQYNKNNNIYYFKNDAGGNVLSLSESDFKFRYPDFDLSNYTLDSLGHPLFKANGLNKTIKYFKYENITVTTKNADGTTKDETKLTDMVYFTDNTKMTFAEFASSADYATFSANWKFDAPSNANKDKERYLYVNKTGTMQYFSSENSKSLSASGGGQFKFYYSYSGLTKEEFDRNTLVLTHYANTGDNKEDTIIYKRSFKKYNWWDTNGYFTTDVSDNNFKIKVESIYQNATYPDQGVALITIEYVSENDALYQGNYDLGISFSNGDTKSVPFELTDAIRDFYLKVDVDKHYTTENSLVGEIPPANQKFEYYLGFHMVKGETDPTSEYFPSIIHPVILTKRANLDGDKKYYYDEIDYQFQIEKYDKTNNKVYGKIKSYNTANENDYPSNYTDLTIDLNNADHKKKYADVIKFLNGFKYGSDGTLDKTSDNYGVTTHTNDSNGNELINGLTIDKYISSGGNSDILVYVNQNFIFNNGNIVRGLIRGFYEDNIEYDNGQDYVAYDEAHTDLFDVEISDDVNNQDHAVTILPKTEVSPGKYYVYVDYGKNKGVGYLNNSEEAVITKTKYPENWNRNIHMSFINYIDPEYKFEVDNPSYTNSYNDSTKAYYNINSSIKFDVKPKYIYNYDDITNKVYYCSSNSALKFKDLSSCDSLEDVTSEFEYIPSLGEYAPLDFDKHYVTLNTVGKNKDGVIKPGIYVLELNYQNEVTNLKGETKTIKATPGYSAFKVVDKYYGIKVNKNKTGTINFARNFSENKTIYADGYFIENPDNVNFSIKYVTNNQDNELLREGNDFYFVADDGSKSKAFSLNIKKYIQDEKTKHYNYEFVLNNVAYNTAIGTYKVTLSYKEENKENSTDTFEFNVLTDQYFYDLSDEDQAISNEDEMAFTKTFVTDYITKEQLKNIKFTVMYNGVDVASSDLNYSERHISSINIVDSSVKCGNEITDPNIDNKKNKCTGIVKYVINRDAYVHDGYYYTTMSDPNGNNPKPYPITNFDKLFKWDIEGPIISGTFSDDEGNSHDVNEFFRNISDTKVTINIPDTSHNEEPKISINKDCLAQSETGCNAELDNYSSYFDININQTKNGNKTSNVITLTPDANDMIPAGSYAIVVRYSSYDYKVIKLDVHSEYVDIKLPEELMLTSVVDNKNVTGLYINANGNVSGPLYVGGIPYNDVNYYVTDTSGNDANYAFEINNTRIVNDHELYLSYKSGTLSAPGEYIINADYTASDGYKIHKDVHFNIDSTYFNIKFDSVKSEPEKLTMDGGKVIVSVSTDNVDNLFTGPDGLQGSSNSIVIKNNTKIYDSNDNDITNKFSIERELTDNSLTTNTFNIVASFTNGSVPAGNYDLRTFLTIEGKTVSASTTFNIYDFKTSVSFDNPVIITKTSDGKIHNNIGGTYRIIYHSNKDLDLSEVNVVLTDSNGKNVESSLISVVKSSTYLDIIYKPTESEKLSYGDYNINISYKDPVSGELTVKLFTVHLYDTYTNLVISNMHTDSTYIYADKENQYYTFDLDSSVLKSDDYKLLTYKVYDADDNDVTDEMFNNITNNINDGSDISKIINYKIPINAFKAPVGKYYVQVLIKDSENNLNGSNKLEFSIDKNYYNIILEDSSFVKPVKSYNTSPDSIYDKDGANVNMVYSSTYSSDNANDYSIKVYKGLKLVKEIKNTDLDLSDDGITYFSNKGIVDGLDEGDYRVSVCIKGLPYTSTPFKVNKYIPISSLSITSDGKLLDKDDYQLSNYYTSLLDYTYEPGNATDTDIKFESGDNNILTINSDLVLSIKNTGDTTLKVYNSDFSKVYNIHVKSALSSNVYKVYHEDPIIYVDSINTKSLDKNIFVNNLIDLASDYKILDIYGKDITSSTKLIGTGMSLVNTNDQTYKIVVKGDINQNGRIDIGDVSYLFNYYLKPKQTQMNKYQKRAAEIVNPVGVGLNDVSKLFNYYLGKISNI